MLETAIDSGIIYFDTARMYGWGRAEGILGKLSGRHRGRLIIASKVGIMAAKLTPFRRVLARVVRASYKAIPGIYFPVPDVWTPRHGLFKLSELQASLETTLKELRTDYLDIFLLHKCKAADVGYPELLDFLLNKRAQGKIRAFGLATGIRETVAILEARAALGPVVQIPNNAWENGMAQLPIGLASLVVTHSCFGGRFRALLDRLASDETSARKWKSMTAVDPRDATAVGKLFLAHALQENTHGIVLFSSSRLENIRANTKVATEAKIATFQIEGLKAFIAAHNGRSGQFEIRSARWTVERQRGSLAGP